MAVGGAVAVRIAMWSGPRTISTALLRSWGNRADTAVSDEPLYAHYLATTGLDHPGREAVLASQSSDWRAVVGELLGPVSDGKAIWYVKHMAHHLLADVGRDWLDGVTNVFLLRDPAELVPSLVEALGPNRVRLADTGLVQQHELFDRVRRRTGHLPAVIDARDVLDDPRGTLSALCDAVGVAFDPAMLSWPAGPRPTDGAWAPHWYAAVERSTGFAPHRPRPAAVPARLRPLVEAGRAHYDALHAHRLT